MPIVMEAPDGLTSRESAKASPKYEPRLLPITIDAIAQSDPSRVLAEFLEAPHHSEETFELTFGLFARVIDRLSWWMSAIGKQAELKTFDTIALAGFLDFRHYAMLILFCSLVTDTSAMERLFQDADVKIFFTTVEEESPPVQRAYSLPTILLPSVEELISPGEVPRFPYSKTYAQAARDPIIDFQSPGSGSTAMRPQWTWTRTYALSADEMCLTITSLSVLLIDAPGDFAVCVAAIRVCLLALGLQCFWTLSSSSFLSTPALLEQLVMLRKIFWIGAPLTWDIARLLVDRTHLATLWGTTETGYLVSFETDPEDWNYLNIDSEREGIQWAEVTPNRFEMRFIKHEAPAEPQVAFLTLPDADVVPSGGLFSPHPTKPDHWKYAGRPDNIIVVKDMLFDPAGIEKEIESLDSVKGAFVFDIKCAVVCLILELYETPQDTQSAFEAVWPTIQKACDGMPEHQVIQPSRVILARSEKPVPRNHKGEVKRPALADLYEAEMSACYR
ncbi:Hypothetical protein PENO1_100590 [Penicillium occitanis (nom. inval.)]|nr:Hypothetical protein PENO1_100590 [Penicillium occitanis (nom. inval.)]PCG90552.1 hypothetical protein PENOC_101500 [Penicillium occitanis (nom. inval.)]